VHLIRDPEAVAQSYARRAGYGIVRAYRTDILMRAPLKNPEAADIDFARDYVDTVTENIRVFLAGKPRTMTVRLETAATDFSRFWDWIGAEGDRAAALAEWRVRHNAST